ncbi:MAG: FHA domain-containing protein [Tannerella sp.]|jgi:hypothetical protein|nr:FHA domain-containing protein [Tannerella sp.]
MIMMINMIGNSFVRYASVVLLIFVPVFGNAQTLRGDFDLTSYPEVSFVWNEYNPDVKDSTQFILFSDSGKIPVGVRNLSFNDTLPKAKTILFLWEDLNHSLHAGQSLFTQTVIYHFLKDLSAGEQDKFNVGVFDRKGGNDLGSSIHTWLSDGFTTDRQTLAEAVRTFSPKYDLFSRQENSELYLAIEEGISRLEKEPSDRVRAIVVFTAGSNLDNYGGRNSIDEARALALKIPVHVVKYPIRGCEHCNNIDLICKTTFGQQITNNNDTVAFSLLKEAYQNMAQRHAGQDYRITFASAFPRDGRQHTLRLSVNGKEYPLTFTAPRFSPKVWIKEHLPGAILIGVGLLFVIALLIILTVRRIKKRRKKILDMEAKQQATQQEAETNRRTLENYRQQKGEEERLAKENEQQQYFSKLMQIKNMFPRLQYSVDGVSQTCTVHKPETTIGRNNDNDLILTSDSVSRHHARLVFNGAGFEIRDLDSANKVIVNGAFTERAALTNGDIIGLGEVVIYFYV